jgi:K(+)-stimulated pyrophosphate-energized sodium pump
MLEISELIYETCKTYLGDAGQVHHGPLGLHRHDHGRLLRRTSSASRSTGRCHPRSSRLVGIAGSYGVAWFGIRVNTFANSRTAFASLEGKPFPSTRSRCKAGMSIGMLLISIELC